MNILFICKYNRFRSRVAASYFNKAIKNKKIKAQSSGLFKGTPINKEVAKLTKKFGIDISGNTRATSLKLLRKQDLVVIVASDVPKSVFKIPNFKAKIISFNIKDVKKEGDKKATIKVIKNIIKKVDKLIKRLENKEI